MKYKFLILLLALSACEPNKYTAVNGVDNSSDARWTAWRACQKESTSLNGLCGGGRDSGFSGCGLSSYQAVGAVSGGVVGGAVGGAIFGAGVAAGDTKKNATDAYTEKCMQDKGYILAHN